MTATLVLLASLVGPAAADDIDAHRWRARLLVVLAPDPGDPRLDEQARILAGAGRGTGERDLLLVAEGGRTARADALRRRFGVPGNEFRAILVGKDGGAKLTSSAPIDAERLFAEIDGMPMRRDEMRRGLAGAPHR